MKRHRPLTERILAALRSGPLYIGALPLIVSDTETRVRKAVRVLVKQGSVTFDGTTVALKEAE